MLASVRVDNAFGSWYANVQDDKQWDAFFWSTKIVSDLIMNNSPPSYKSGDPYDPRFPTKTTEGVIAYGIASGIVDSFTAVKRMNELRPGMNETMEANCQDFYNSVSNFQFWNKKIKKGM